jgi:aspartyl protease family protein
VRNLLWFLLALGSIALLFISLEQNGITVKDLSALDVSPLAINAVSIVLLSVIVLSLVRKRVSEALKSIMIWIALATALAIGYTYRFELREVADRVMAELVPGHAATRGNTVEIARGQGGNFMVATQVNGARLPMILDTGASSVVLTHDAAKAAGLPLEMLSYSVAVETANGRTRAAPVTLQSITIGGLVEREVPALIAQPGQLRQSLLGMSFLNRLQSWEVRGDRLMLRAYP